MLMFYDNILCYVAFIAVSSDDVIFIQIFR